MNDYREIAKTVLQRAQAHDPRMMVSLDAARLRADAWGTVFANKVWPDEAVAAVDAHYSTAGAFPILAGDVVAYCQKQPVWSSEGHVADFLRRAPDYPYSGAIGLYAGIEEPVIDIPAGTPRHREREVLTFGIREWVAKNRDDLTDRIIRTRYTGIGVVMR